ncbi:DUF3231 family protein [Virgibacillus oceani]|uniref:DUF3231 family protein n=1 Tax=Virgibacillus oceani TaxID=1479511 RepID=A0A917MC44_9BACI|nr:DUF3231 family protein [Virgibacillus oceani]GGG88006.1 hypothetical protein GCM10011398_37470 [Virgibacillus oceani]
MTHDSTHLTSSEIASLWTAYMNDSMSRLVLNFMLKYMEDPEIKSVVQTAYDISVTHLEELEHIFDKESFAIPNGFSDRDVNMDAPWLFSDIFCLTYVNQMAKVGMLGYSGFLAMCAREDIRKYFTQGLSLTAELYNQSADTALAKGIFSRHPYIEVPKETDYVNDKSYFNGLNPFSEKRPLNTVEISHLYMNILTNSMGIKLCLAFAQTSPAKEIQEYMLRGKEISQKHIKIFSQTLLDNDIQTPRLPDISVSESTTQTFSDKLLMFHMSLIASAGIGNYAAAGSASQRTDLVVNYERLSFETAKYAKKGADIMINNGWLEQPPGTKDRNKLARKKES